MHVLYHNCPEQRTLLITHSNQALNDLFQKLLERDVPARYLLRLGMGEEELETALDFSRVGRVNAMLARRLELLAEARPPVLVAWALCQGAVPPVSDPKQGDATAFLLPAKLRRHVAPQPLSHSIHQEAWACHRAHAQCGLAMESVLSPR